MPKLILAVVLIVCIGAVMGLMGWALTKKQTRVEAPEVKTPTEIIKDETADWQTYRNEKYGTEFKHPKDFPFFQQPELLINKIDPNSLSAKICAEGKSEGVTIKKIIVGENTFCSYVTKKSAAAGSAYTDYKYSIIKDDKDYVIHFVVKYTSCGVYGDETELKYIECEEFNNKIAPKIINQILSTFKFIEKDETADWKVYWNEEYGFELKYPNYLMVREDKREIDKGIAVHFCASVENVNFSGDWKQECFGDLSLGVFLNNEKLSLRDYLGREYNFSDLKFDVIETSSEIFALKPKEKQSDEYYKKFGELGSGLEYSYWIAAYQNYVLYLGHGQNGILDFDREKVANQILSTFKFIEK